MALYWSMMEVRFTYEPNDYDRFAAFTKRNAARPETLYDRVRYPVAFSTTMLLALYFTIQGSQSGARTGDPEMFICGVFYGLALVLTIGAVRRMLRRRQRRASMVAMPLQAVRMTDSGLTWIAGDKSVEIRWAAIEELNEDADCLYFLSTDVWRIIPRRAFESTDAAAEFFRLARESVFAVEPGTPSMPPPPTHHDPAVWPPPPGYGIRREE